MKTERVPPYKSVAMALLFCVILGPLGLLYASFWGGIIMLILTIIVFSSKFFFPSLLIWLICSIWGVGAAEAYNRNILEAIHRITNAKRNH